MIQQEQEAGRLAIAGGKRGYTGETTLKGYGLTKKHSHRAQQAHAHGFDIRADLTTERAGGIFCHACLTGRTDHSPDPRYCQRCYEFRLQEAELLPPGKRPKWVPVAPAGNTAPRTEAQRHGHNSSPTVSTVPDKPLIMSTSKRGPKNKVLPEDLIVKLAGEA